MKNSSASRFVAASIVGLVLTSAGIATACHRTSSSTGPRTFSTPDEAVRALAQEVRNGDVNQVLAIFGPDGRVLVDSSDPVTARRNREIFTAAINERWRLEDQGAGRKVLVVGNEDWPFPVPLVKEGNAWRFDTAAGKEEVLARRIGRNELAAIRAAHAYATAQRVYAKHGHDGKPQGVYARAFLSDPGRQNGLYWPAHQGEKRSPLGDLLAGADAAAAQRTAAGRPQPFHGYYFKILTSQGPAAPGGARNYVANGEMTGGFALVAWPAQYDVTGVMTFLLNHAGILWEKDLGPETETVARSMTVYNPDPSWTAVR